MPDSNYESGSKVRADPARHWHCIAEEARPYFVIQLVAEGIAVQAVRAAATPLQPSWVQIAGPGEWPGSRGEPARTVSLQIWQAELGEAAPLAAAIAARGCHGGPEVVRSSEMLAQLVAAHGQSRRLSEVENGKGWDQ